MSNVIGYKGTEQARKIRWLALRELKQTDEVFRHPENEEQQAVKTKDRELFNRFLVNYIAA